MQIKSTKKLSKNLFKYYKKYLKKLSKKDIKEERFPIDYLVTYLMFMRDKAILETDKNNLTEDVAALTFCSAVNEIEEYESCIQKYFKVSEQGVAQQIDQTKSKEDVMQELKSEMDSHWATFWNLVAIIAYGFTDDGELK